MIVVSVSPQSRASVAAKFRLGVTEVSHASEYMKIHIFELRRMMI